MGLILLVVVLAVFAVLFLSEGDARPKRLDDRTVLWIFLGIVVPLSAAVVEHLSLNPLLSWITVLGSVIFVLGVVVRWVARITLGKFFTYEVKVTNEHKLIRKGIYKYIRHPLYTGILLLCFGAIVLLQSSVGFMLLLIVLVPALWHRMKVEEAFLLKAFGKRYQNYMKTTKRLIPGVY